MPVSIDLRLKRDSKNSGKDDVTKSVSFSAKEKVRITLSVSGPETEVKRFMSEYKITDLEDTLTIRFDKSQKKLTE